MRAAVIFPGQGSQSVGMGGTIVEQHPLAVDLFARAARVLGYDLLQTIRNATEETLRETRLSQPAIFVTNYALAVLATADDHLDLVASAGHSFAEFCSLTLAGALTFDNALALVHERALAMQAAAEVAPGGMAAVLGLDVHGVAAAVAAARAVGRVQLANINAPGQIVISGDRVAVAEAERLAREAGAKRVVALNVSGAWHSELMESARARFAPFVERVPLEMPRFTVVSNVDAEPYRDVATIRANLIRSVTDEVLWHATAERLVSMRLDLLVECGGSAVLAPLAKRLADAPKAIHVGDEKGLEKLAAAACDPAAVS